MPDLRREQARPRPTAGVDEVGRGPLAGPVVAAAVVLPPAHLLPAPLHGLDDSKALRRDEREELLAALKHAARRGLVWLAVGQADVEEIDRLNVLEATMLAMQRAVRALPFRPAHVLVDGNRAPGLPCPVEPVPKGDTISLSIAAASVVAKVTRDRIMSALAGAHPEYGWERNAGYATAEHRDALGRIGPSPYHRTTFAPVRSLLTGA